MRIAGGEFRGRTIKVPPGEAVRPTQDRVREALFSMIHFDLQGKTFLDLFAGSGAVALEALSRGAASATLVESNPRHFRVASENVRTLKCEGRVSLVEADVFLWIRGAGGGRRFGIAFADPPYALIAEAGYAGILEALSTNDVVAPGGLFIAEMHRGSLGGGDPLRGCDEVDGWDLCRDRTYGQTRLVIWKRRDG